MKTVAFYSYKGGTGRSLAVAQFAACLAWFGKRVCVIDFDLEAPGACHKLSLLQASPWLQFVDMGLLDYLKEFITSSEQSERFAKCPTCGQDVQGELPSLDDLLRELDPVKSKTVPIPFGSGRIDVFHPGVILSRPADYFSLLAEQQIHEFLTLTGPYSDYFLALRSRLESDLKVDYLLIDSRSGVNELAGICTQILADKVVLISCTNRDGLDGTNMILKALEKAEPSATPSPKIPFSRRHFLALSRLPEAYIDDRGRYKIVKPEERQERLKGCLQELNRGLEHQNRVPQLFPLTSCPRLEWDERIPIAFTQPSVNSQLCYDYAALFDAILSEERLTLSESLDPYIRDVMVLRPFYLVQEEGKIINPDDDSWNVAFRVDTLTTFFDNMYESIAHSEMRGGASEEEAHKTANDELFRNGELAASQFSTVLQEGWKDQVDAASGPQAKLEQWCVFDSKVGFGVFSVSRYGTGEEGTVTLRNNFLLYGRGPGDNNLCAFMQGYITRVLSAIFYPQHIEVSHDRSKQCGQMQEGDKRSCAFSYRVAPGSA